MRPKIYCGISRDFNKLREKLRKNLINYQSKKYNNILETFHFKQHIAKWTRMQKTLTDHIITDILEKPIHQNVVVADK